MSQLLRSDASVQSDQRRSGVTGNPCSASTLDEEAGWLNLPKKNRQVQICMRSSTGGAVMRKKKQPTCKLADSGTIPCEHICLQLLSSPLFYLSHSFALIVLLNWAKPATGRKRLGCSVCLTACVSVFVCVGGCYE